MVEAAEAKFETAEPVPSATRYVAAMHFMRVLLWGGSLGCLFMAVFGDRKVSVLAGFFALALGVLAWLYDRPLRHYARAARQWRRGCLAVTAAGLGIDHPALLSAEVMIPWSCVAAVCVDDGHGHNERWTEPRSRFRLQIEAADVVLGYQPRQLFTTGPRNGKHVPRIPLLASFPAVPNVLVIIRPPTTIPWSYEFVSGPFNPPRGNAWPIRPWRTAAETPALFITIGDPVAFTRAISRWTLVRLPTWEDFLYLEAQGLTS